MGTYEMPSAMTTSQGQAASAMPEQAINTNDLEVPTLLRRMIKEKQQQQNQGQQNS
jgi:hypothetical protein